MLTFIRQQTSVFFGNVRFDRFFHYEQALEIETCWLLERKKEGVGGRLFLNLQLGRLSRTSQVCSAGLPVFFAGFLDMQ